MNLLKEYKLIQKLSMGKLGRMENNEIISRAPTDRGFARGFEYKTDGVEYCMKQ